MKGRDIMLSKEAKQILNYLKPLLLAGEDTIDSSSVIKATGLPEIEVKALLKHLHQEKYFKYSPNILGEGTIYAPQYKALHYEEFETPTTSAMTQTNIFNGSISNSAIGNTGTVTVNNGISFEDAHNIIQSQNISTEDKLEIEKVITYIETLVENDSPLQKGFLSKFSDILSKHHWLPELVIKLIFQYLTGIPL